MYQAVEKGKKAAVFTEPDRADRRSMALIPSPTAGA